MRLNLSFRRYYHPDYLRIDQIYTLRCLVNGGGALINFSIFFSDPYFPSSIMRKHFLLWTKETAFFPYFHHGIIFYSAELFDCAVNFKFYMNTFVFLNINTNQTSKQQYLNLEAVIYFGIGRTKRFWKKSVRPTISQVFYPLRVFLRILVTFSRPVFLQNFP